MHFLPVRVPDPQSFCHAASKPFPLPLTCRPAYDRGMDERPSFRFCFGVATVMVVLTLISLMLFVFASAGDMHRAAWFSGKVIFPVAGGLGGVGLILFAINWLNLRDDPRNSKLPPDDP